MLSSPKSRFIGIDLAWSRKNKSFIVIIEERKNQPTIIGARHLELDETIGVLQGLEEKERCIIGVDAPLVVRNETGNRTTEVEFLRDYSRYRLGVYPVNRTLFRKTYGMIAGEELMKRSGGCDIVEVYPHATILELFNDRKVLPYKYKRGRNKAFYTEQLSIYTDMLSSRIGGVDRTLFDTSTLRSLKLCEDYLDSVTCAYTLYYCAKYPGLCRRYGSTEDGLLIVPVLNEG